MASAVIRPGIRSGDLRHRIDVQARTETQSASGGLAFTWSTIVGGARLPASVEPLVGKEWHAAQQRTSNVSTRFRLRYTPVLVGAGVTSTAYRIVWDGRVFDIISAIQVRGLRHELVVMANEDVGKTP